MPWWGGFLIGIVVGLIIGAIIGFFVAQKIFKKQLKDNPPVNESMIRAMYAQMGRKPTERQIKSVMNAMKSKSRLK